MSKFKYVLIASLFIFFFGLQTFAQEQKPESSGQGSGRGFGIGNGNGKSETNSENSQDNQTAEKLVSSKTNRGVMIESKPRPVYTDKARAENLEGKVILKITFRANATIGKIKVVKGLGDLTQQAVEAAKKIRFQPAMKNGKPYTVTRNVEYTFTLY